MKKIQVKVFNAYTDFKNRKYYEDQAKDEDYFDIFDFHNSILDDDGYVSENKDYGISLSNLKIKPLEEDIEIKTKYVLDDEEQNKLDNLEKEIEECEKKYIESKQHLSAYQNELLEKAGIDFYLLEGTDAWKCNLSPLGRCVYEWDGNEYSCIFCGEPEERK